MSSTQWIAQSAAMLKCVLQPIAAREPCWMIAAAAGFVLRPEENCVTALSLEWTA